MIICCGVSNKKDTSPLCSKTLAGKIVDQIVSGLEVTKINFFDKVMQKPPTKKEIIDEIKSFKTRTKDATIVILFSGQIGKFLNDKKYMIVKHPSYISQYRKKELQKYIDETRENIKKYLQGLKND